MQRLMIALVLSCAVASAMNAHDRSLARRLADPKARQSAVNEVEKAGSKKIPLLLSWTRHPPARVNALSLNIGLADAFGALKAKEAVPFLIKNISLDRTGALDTLMRSEDVIESQMPSVAALIRIGGSASDAVMRACWGPMTSEDRLAAIFVVSRSAKEIPDARGFLNVAIAYARMQHDLAERGLKRLQGRP